MSLSEKPNQVLTGDDVYFVVLYRGEIIRVEKNQYDDWYVKPRGMPQERTGSRTRTHTDVRSNVAGRSMKSVMKLSLKLIEGLTHQTLADKVQLPVSTVRKWVPNLKVPKFYLHQAKPKDWIAFAELWIVPDFDQWTLVEMIELGMPKHVIYRLEKKLGKQFHGRPQPFEPLWQARARLIAEGILQEEDNNPETEAETAEAGE